MPSESTNRKRLLTGGVLAVLVVAGTWILWRPQAPEPGQPGTDGARPPVASGDAPAPPELPPWERTDYVPQPVSAADTVLPSRLTAFTVGPQQIDDPRRDGWSTEVVSSLIGKRIKQLAGLAAVPQRIDADTLGAWAGPAFACPDLRPATLMEVFRHRTLRVRRGTFAPDAPADHRGTPGLAAALRGLLAGLDDATAVHGKGKIDRIEALDGQGNPRRYRCRTIVWFDGHLPDGSFERHATWRTTWSYDGRVAALEAIEPLEYEETLASTPDHTLLVDATGSVITSPRVQRQIVPGIQHWLDRLDVSLQLDFEGMQGLAVADVDGDGRDDLYACQGAGLPDLMLVQRPDGTVRDEAAEAEVDFLETSRSALLVDLDNDGDPDLVLATDDRLRILENDGGESVHFTERARFDAIALGFSLAAADPDADGDLDLYVCRYFPESRKGVGQLPNPVPYHDANNGGGNVFLRNDGAWSFTDATAAVGLDANNQRWSYAAAWEDYDDDGDVDLYVANDFGRNNLYRNDGGRFTDVAAAAGVEDVASGMSVTWGDVDNDGDMDLYVSNMWSSAGGRITYQPAFKTEASASTKAQYQRLARGNSLFANQGDGHFTDVSAPAAVLRGRWAWGSRFLDLDRDGWLDLVVANGYVTGWNTGDL